jgi:hypothetical protein
MSDRPTFDGHEPHHEGFLLAGVGMGLGFVPVTIGAVSGVSAREAGVASGLLNTTEEIGGAVGVAVLSTIAVSVTTRFVTTRPHSPQVAIAGLIHGFSVAFWCGTLFAAVGGIVALVGLTKLPSGPPEPVPTSELTQAG